MIQMINKEFTLARLSTLWSLARSDAQKKLLERAMQVVGQTQAEDVMPVVRCRGCRHYNTEGFVEGYGWCHQHIFGTNDEWYCADCEHKDAPACGARKDGEITDGT